MTYAKKTLAEIKLIHGDYGNFIKGQKLDRKKEKKYTEPPYKDLAASNEIDGEPLDEKCWPGYEKKGKYTAADAKAMQDRFNARMQAEPDFDSF